MEPLPLEKPLKILTLDGGGLQAISTLLILDKLLDTIQETNQAATKPRPCDVFDVIAGIGAGGWLALLLGRFRLDTKTCLTEWYKLIQCIAPRSRSQGIRRRVFAHSYFDEKLLVKRVDRLTALYGTGNTLLDPYPSDARCKYVFVAAAQKAHRLHEAEVYNLFRTYGVDKDRKLRAGPSEPTTFTIARAFGATGAARYFSAPWKEHIAADGKTSFLDSAFPRPHNITLLALDEMWALHGADAPISVIVNIGPGFPTDADLSWIARRFSWGLKKPAPASVDYYKAHYGTKRNGSPKGPEALSPNGRPAAPGRDSQKSMGNIAYGPRNRKFREEETTLEDRIRKQLREHYGQPPPYYRLGPDSAPQGTAQNDAREPGAILDATSAYCESRSAVTSIDEISRIVEVSA
ncbi:hypothetical protein MMC10_006371 [Thelotrema lepadinum]|nr:hypothetical protein [Thelotrema lepadinum]